MLCNVKMSLNGQRYIQMAAPPTEPEAGFGIGLTAASSPRSPRGETAGLGTPEHLPAMPVVLLLSENMQHRLKGRIAGVSRAKRVADFLGWCRGGLRPPA